MKIIAEDKMKMQTYAIDLLEFQGDQCEDKRLADDELKTYIETSFSRCRSDLNKYCVSVHVSVGCNCFKTSFRCAIKLVGSFHIDDDCDSDTKNKLISVSAPSIVYGIARDKIATLSSLSRIGNRYFLPTVYFQGFDIDKFLDETKQDYEEE